MLLTTKFDIRGANKIERDAVKQLSDLINGDFELSEKIELDIESAYFEVNNGDSLIGYLVLSKSTGLFERFDFMIYLSTSFKGEMVRILHYPSTYGIQVTSRKWLKQFIGNSGETLRYGRDISAISGATKSAAHLTRDIPKVISMLKDKLMAP